MVKSQQFLRALVSLICLTHWVHSQRYDAFGEADEAAYLAAFPELIKDSYSAPLPAELTTRCKNRLPIMADLPTLTISSSMTSTNLQTFCGENSICTIPSGLTVTMNSNLNLAALIVSGTLNWNDATQPTNDQWICAGYIGVTNF